MSVGTGRRYVTRRLRLTPPSANLPGEERPSKIVVDSTSIKVAAQPPCRFPIPLLISGVTLKRNETVAGGPRVADSKRRLQLRASTPQYCAVQTNVSTGFDAWAPNFTAIWECRNQEHYLLLRRLGPFGLYTRRRVLRTHPASGTGHLVYILTWLDRKKCNQMGIKMYRRKEMLSWRELYPTGAARARSWTSAAAK